MGPISLTTAIDAPRERVFDLIADLSRRPGWIDHFAEDYRLERIEPVGEGAAARFRAGAPAIPFMETVIVEAESPSRIVEAGRGGRWNRIPIHTTWELVPDPGPVTTVKLTFWTEPAVRLDRMRELGRGGWWKRRWRKALRRLREAVESGAEEIEPVRVAGGAHLPAGAG